ncbi:hypothetical protein D1AOALGA4SA_6065 [Olavius algarvensis Delta 1 endosymbiont]|nr:hypothetical protein D1AOALGA4SA_6065 [Olavius algarvensis Delta 1 endosymbiont]
MPWLNPRPRWEKWPQRCNNSPVFRFQVSGFGCQEVEVLDPDT